MVREMEEGQWKKAAETSIICNYAFMIHPKTMQKLTLQTNAILIILVEQVLCQLSDQIFWLFLLEINLSLTCIVSWKVEINCHWHEWPPGKASVIWWWNAHSFHAGCPLWISPLPQLPLGGSRRPHQLSPYAVFHNKREQLPRQAHTCPPTVAYTPKCPSAIFALSPSINSFSLTHVQTRNLIPRCWHSAHLSPVFASSSSRDHADRGPNILMPDFIRFRKESFKMKEKAAPRS